MQRALLRTTTLLPLGLLALLLSPVSAQTPPESPALPDLSGTWAQVQVTTTISELPVVGDVIGKTTSILLLDVTQDGDTLRIKPSATEVEFYVNGEKKAVWKDDFRGSRIGVGVL